MINAEDFVFLVTAKIRPDDDLVSEPVKLNPSIKDLTFAQLKELRQIFKQLRG